jgi:hypothetical protein
MPMLQTRDAVCGCAVPAVDAPVACSATPRWLTSVPARGHAAEDVR